MPLQKPSTSVEEFFNHLHESLSPDNLEAFDSIHEAGLATLALLPTRPEAVRNLAYKKLNVYPFKDVPVCWRRAYEESCLWDLFSSLKSVIDGVHSDSKATTSEPSVNAGSNKYSALEQWMNNAVELCDRAIIFTGAPGRRRLIDEVLTWIDARHCYDLSSSSACPPCDEAKPDLECENERPKKRRRVSDVDRRGVSMPSRFPRSSLCSVPILKQECSIVRLKKPSLDQFESHMHKVGTPLIITNTIDHWPACERWQDPDYWDRCTLGGRRLVPVELGSSYTDEGWGQKIVPFKEFMLYHLLARNQGCERTPKSPKSSNMNGLATSTSEIGNDEDSIQNNTPVGYLAQYDLLNQIPALRNDIAIPDYCYIDSPESTLAAAASNGDIDDLEPPEATEPLLNIWLGPANTVSPAHTDPHHNILAQVFGRKYVRLFAPSQTAKMYPMGNGQAENAEESSGGYQPARQGVDMGNTSRVDVGAFLQFEKSPTHGNGVASHADPSGVRVEQDKFPGHEAAEYAEAILHPGECLYIPRGWWHYIRSLEPSCNVSFWWD